MFYETLESKTAQFYMRKLQFQVPLSSCDPHSELDWLTEIYLSRFNEKMKKEKRWHNEKPRVKTMNEDREVKM